MQRLTPFLEREDVCACSPPAAAYNVAETTDEPDNRHHAARAACGAWILSRWIPSACSLPR